MTPLGAPAHPWHSAPASARSGFLRRFVPPACSCSLLEPSSSAPKNIRQGWPAPPRSESPNQKYAAPPPASLLAGAATAESPACTSDPSAETSSPIRGTRCCLLLRFQTAAPCAHTRQPAFETKPTPAAPQVRIRSANPVRKSANPLWDRTPQTHDRETDAPQSLPASPVSRPPVRDCPAFPPARSSRTPRKVLQDRCPYAATCCAKK